MGTGGVDGRVGRVSSWALMDSVADIHSKKNKKMSVYSMNDIAKARSIQNHCAVNFQ